MEPSQLQISAAPKLQNATLLLALTGWMDGGDVSTGTVKHLIQGREKLTEIARIDPEDFYIYNFPGSMEIAALFRPHVKYVDGVVEELEFPTNIFVCDEAANLVFFIGKEPNLRWQQFADCIFTVVKQLGITRIIFIGSFGGSVPHTREPRLFGSASHPHLRETLRRYHVRLSDYEGPASFATLVLQEARKHNVEMLSFAAEIPGYLQGLNPLSIEAVTRRLSAILDLPINFDKLREASNEWEAQVSAEVEKNEELAETIRKLEEQYDNELIEGETESHTS
jgi:proteasome assembly chaperone (PAC2) family protein